MGYNHRVSVFDTKGTYLHCFGTEENGESFDRLYALAVTSTEWSSFFNSNTNFLLRCIPEIQPVWCSGNC